MENGIIAQNEECFTTAFSNFNFTVGVIILPFHLLMVKVLVMDLRLALPRHLIIFCLSVSDALQIFTTFLVSAIVRIFSLTIESDACHSTTSFLRVNISVTLVVSSLSITMLAVERYVACIHSFRLHEMFTRDRTVYSIMFIWALGIICGTVTVILDVTDRPRTVLDVVDFMRIATVVFVFPTSLVISVIQFRLLVFSRKKLVRVRQMETFGREAESADWKKKQMKVAFIASMISITYMTCMLPIGVSCVYELADMRNSSQTTPVIIRVLALLNNLADPYIYGFGIVDTRRAVLKNLQRMKALLTRS